MRRSDLVAGAVHSALGSAFWYAFYVRYWAWRDGIAQASSSCVTPEGDSLIAGGVFWSAPAVLFTLAAARRAARLRRR